MLSIVLIFACRFLLGAKSIKNRKQELELRPAAHLLPTGETATPNKKVKINIPVFFMQKILMVRQ